MKVFAFAASQRAGSLNKKLVRQAGEILRASEGVELDLADFKDFGMPVYDGDLEESSGLPDGARKLVSRIRSADALVISTPEYNGGIPGALKNAIDWVSRDDADPLDGKPLLLIGASPGALGAVRSLWHTRVPFEAMGVRVYPEMFGLPRAGQAFDDSGQFTDPKNRSRLSELIQGYLRFARALKQSG
jgi:chromate reductase